MVDATVTAAATVAAVPAPTITLVIDTKAKRVLFAEAGKDAVDFLFCILATPVGTVARQLRDDEGAQAVGVAKMYDSAEKMDLKYMRSLAVRNSLLNSHKHTLLTHPTIGLKHWPGSTVPAASTSTHGTATMTTTTTPVYALSSMPVLSTSVHGTTTTTPRYAPSMPTYGPQYAASTFVHGPTTTTTPTYAPSMPTYGPQCAASTFVQGLTTTTAPVYVQWMPAPATSVQGPTPYQYAPSSMPVMSTSCMPQYAAAVTAPASTVAGGCPSCGCAGGCSSPTAAGFVQDTVTYTVMDDLTIAPRSNLSVMLLSSKVEGEDKHLALQEKSVQLGAQEGMDILKASLRSNTVLTDVFLSKNTTDIVPLSNNKRARTTSVEENDVQEKNEKIPNYFI